MVFNSAALIAFKAKHFSLATSWRQLLTTVCSLVIIIVTVIVIIIVTIVIVIIVIVIIIIVIVIIIIVIISSPHLSLPALQIWCRRTSRQMRK